MKEQPNFNKDKNIEEEVREIFQEQELFDEKGKPLPLKDEIDIRKSIKPKPVPSFVTGLNGFG